MTYKPTVLDAASDLRRCIYASYTPEGFNDPNFVTFFQHAQKVLLESGNILDKRLTKIVNGRLRKAQDESNPLSKRREDLLVAAILLQNASK